MKIIYIVRNRQTNEFYGVDNQGNLIFTYDYLTCLHFDSEEDILAYSNNGFSFPSNSTIHSFIVNKIK